jgi:cytochrome P450
LFSVVAVTRKTLKEFTFSNGVKVPSDVNIVIPSMPHRDPEVFEDPSKFDGFRFVKMKERAAMKGYSDKRFDMVAIGAHSLAFGHGRNACPGRFLAASELKMMLAYVVVTYDVKLADGIRPPDLYVIHNCIPNRTAEVLFRRRRV